MFKNFLRFSLAMFIILSFSIISFVTFAKADGDRGEKSRHGHYHYRHHDGRWYTHKEVTDQRAPSVHINLW